MQARDRKHRVLLIAEAANPEWVSVPLVGWSQYCAIAKLANAHLVTQVRNREAILRAGLTEGRDFTSIDSEAVAWWIWRLTSLVRGGRGKGWTTVTALAAISYYYFEHLVWQRFGAQIKRGEWDIVHRVTPLSPTIPSTLALRCREAGVPFVLGPLNGGVPWPRGFDGVRRAELEWLSYVRDAYKLLPGYRATLQSAAALLVASRDTWQQLPRRYRGKAYYLPENAIEPNRFQMTRQHVASRPLRVVFVGRLVPYKGADMLLEAAAELLRSGEMQLEIFGEGPQSVALKDQAARYQLNGHVRFAGWVDHKELQQRISSADVFAFPSIREFGGGAVLEAMAVGLVPIVVDYGGPGELVTERCGYLIPMGRRDEIISRLRQILSELVVNPALVEGKSAEAVRRVREHFTWDAKAKQVLKLYDWVAGECSQRPEFAMPIPDVPDESLVTS